MNRTFARFGVPCWWPPARCLLDVTPTRARIHSVPRSLAPFRASASPRPSHSIHRAAKRWRPTDQPITLIVENASTTGVRPLEYLFEVASDSAFSQKLFARDGITPGDGRTSLRLPDALATGHTYYWRARAQDGANTGPYSAPIAFQVMQPISIDAPTLIGPVGGATVTDNPPQLRIKNANRLRSGGRDGVSGPGLGQRHVHRAEVRGAGARAVRRDARDAKQSAAGSAKFYWRARATDGANTGPWSGTASFITPADAPNRLEVEVVVVVAEVVAVAAAVVEAAAAVVAAAAPRATARRSSTALQRSTSLIDALASARPRGVRTWSSCATGSSRPGCAAGSTSAGI